MKLFFSRVKYKFQIKLVLKYLEIHYNFSIQFQGAGYRKKIFCHFITKTSLLKKTENFTTKKNENFQTKKV